MTQIEALASVPLGSEKATHPDLHPYSYSDQFQFEHLLTSYSVAADLLSLREPEAGSTPVVITDVGCGVGNGMAYLTERLRAEGLSFQINGIEINASDVQRAQDRMQSTFFDNWRVTHGGIEQLAPSLQGSSDLVIAAHLLDYLPWGEANIDTLVKIARPGGTLLIVLPNMDLPYAIAHGQRWSSTIVKIAQVAKSLKKYGDLSIKNVFVSQEAKEIMYRRSRLGWAQSFKRHIPRGLKQAVAGLVSRGCKQVSEKDFPIKDADQIDPEATDVVLILRRSGQQA